MKIFKIVTKISFFMLTAIMLVLVILMMSPYIPALKEARGYFSNSAYPEPYPFYLTSYPSSGYPVPTVGYPVPGYPAPTFGYPAPPIAYPVIGYPIGSKETFMPTHTPTVFGTPKPTKLIRWGTTFTPTFTRTPTTTSTPTFTAYPTVTQTPTAVFIEKDFVERDFTVALPFLKPSFYTKTTMRIQ